MYGHGMGSSAMGYDVTWVDRSLHMVIDFVVPASMSRN